MSDYVAMACMFFAGLILLIPHRIGMSRVNYVIKRYNLPISRAGLLLYKYHNNIELSLLCGAVLGGIITSVTCKLVGDASVTGPGARDSISIGMIDFLSFMLLSSIIMLYIYVSGGDFGHLNAFYFSLIFLTLFDGFTNAFAFGINAKYSSLLSAGIPLSGLLVTILHNIYKSFYDSFLWDDFDYYVLRLQLLCNILIILIAIILWSVDQVFDMILISKDSHANNDNGVKTCQEQVQSGQCGISSHTSGHTVANINDLWDVISNSTIKIYHNFGGKCPHKLGVNGDLMSLFSSDHMCDWSPILLLAISLAILPLVIALLDTDYGNVGQWGPAGKVGTLIDPSATGTFDKNSSNNLYVYDDDGTYPKSSSRYSSTGSYTWQDGDQYQIWNGATWDTAQPIKASSGYIENWTKDRKEWHLVWICLIPYILCIQIFMSLLHYPESLLSCIFNNNPYLIVFISILFNTLRELMQALGFSGAGKQYKIHNKQYTLFTLSSTPPSQADKDKVRIILAGYTNKYIKPTTSATLTIPTTKFINPSITALNKPITLFVMMFCVFTGDGYLQHYRRCCRDCWPTTGYIASHYLVQLTTSWNNL